MAIELFNPDGLPKPEPYRQVAVASGSRLVFLAGQVARTATGEPVGIGDLAAQVEQAYLNVATGLAAVGGGFDDVAKLTLYIVDWSGDKMAALGEGVGRAAARLGVDPVKPITLIPVAALGEPDLLVEVDATAVLDKQPARTREHRSPIPFRGTRRPPLPRRSACGLAIGTPRRCEVNR